MAGRAIFPTFPIQMLRLEMGKVKRLEYWKIPCPLRWEDEDEKLIRFRALAWLAWLEEVQREPGSGSGPFKRSCEVCRVTLSSHNTQAFHLELLDALSKSVSLLALFASRVEGWFTRCPMGTAQLFGVHRKFQSSKPLPTRVDHIWCNTQPGGCPACRP